MTTPNLMPPIDGALTSQPNGLEPIATAPKDGEHILGVAIGGKGFGYLGSFPEGHYMDFAVVCHWFEDGLYASSVATDEPYTNLTHWMRIPQVVAPDICATCDGRGCPTCNIEPYPITRPMIEFKDAEVDRAVEAWFDSSLSKSDAHKFRERMRAALNAAMVATPEAA